MGKTTATNALKLLIGYAKFVHGRRDIMGQSRKNLCYSSLLLKAAKDCVSVKVNQVRANPLTTEKVLDEFHKVEQCKS